MSVRVKSYTGVYVSFRTIWQTGNGGLTLTPPAARERHKFERARAGDISGITGLNAPYED